MECSCGARRIDGQIGLERSIGEYVETMVGVMREVRRVLRGDGTVWMNLGDSYCGSWANYGGGDRGVGKQRLIKHGSSAQNPVWEGLDGWRPPASYPQEGLKPKDLCGIPWRVALALQADGWYLRSDVIWAKPNPMPESVEDRPTRSHEYLFLLSKSERYYYDADAIREPQNWNGTSGPKNYRPNALNGRIDAGMNSGGLNDAGRNRRDVWTINSEPYPEAHFATFPKALVQPCVLAGTPERGSCGVCGKPWVRVTEKPQPPETLRNRGNGAKMDFHSRQTGSGQKLQDWYDEHPSRTLGWRAQCGCGAAPRPSLVFDPFLGSGTVGEVCEALGRRWVGTDLSMDYLRMAQRRTAQRGLFSTVMEVSR